MKTLRGFAEYITSKMMPSVFDHLVTSGREMVFRRFDGTELSGIVSENQTYDIKIRSLPAVRGKTTQELIGSFSAAGVGATPDSELQSAITPPLQTDVTACDVTTVAEAPQETIIPKVEIICVFSPEHRQAIATHNKGAKADVQPPEQPLRSPKARNYIKNRTLYTLIMERTVVLITLLDGTILRGLISGFNRYEISMTLKGGTPLVVLRHGVLHAQDKSGRSLLKKDQDKFKDWKKSPLYADISQHQPPKKTVAPNTLQAGETK